MKIGVGQFMIRNCWGEMDNTVEDIKNVLLGKNCSTCMYSRDRHFSGMSTCVIKDSIYDYHSDLCESWQSVDHKEELL